MNRLPKCEKLCSYVSFTATTHYTIVSSLAHAVTCMYHVDPLGQLECDGSLWAWLHAQAAGYVEGESWEGACRFKYMELCAGGVANKCLDVEVSGCVLIGKERDLDDVTEPVRGRMARGREGRRERENKKYIHQTD